MEKLMCIAAAAILSATTASGFEVNFDTPLEAVTYCLIAALDDLRAHQPSVPDCKAVQALGNAARTLNPFRRQQPHA